MACLFVTGAADMIGAYVRQSFVQGVTPDAMRGRVSAVNTVFIGAAPAVVAGSRQSWRRSFGAGC